MAKITKTASGKYTTIGFRIEPDGKRKRKRFTYPDKTKVKAECAAWEAGGRKENSLSNMTLGEAMERYIDARDGSLKVSTIRSYRSAQKSALKGIQSVKLRDLSNELIQAELSEARKTRSSKTVKNWCGLLTATLNMFYPDFKVDVKIKKGKKREPSVPVDEQVKMLLTAAKGTDVELPIVLAAMGSLRVGEIAALTTNDIRATGVRVNKDMARDQNGKWVIEETPKTEAGERVAPLPNVAIKMLKKHAAGLEPGSRLFNLNPEQIYKHYKRLRDKCGIERCRFHDLRHYYASMAHLLGVPDQYIMKYGGWADKGTLTRIYQQAQDDYVEEESKKITEFFGDMISGI